jgi:hypothetical protein
MNAKCNPELNYFPIFVTPLKLFLSLLDELKINYDKDRKILEDRLVSMTREKVDADARARAAFSEALHNDARAKALEKLLR